MVWPGRHDMVYGMAWRAWQDIWYGRHGMENGMTWQDGTVYRMAWRAWQGIWNGLGEHSAVYRITLVDMALYTVWPGMHGNGICYGLTGI